MQSYLTYIIIALALACVIRMILRRIFGKGDACGCGGDNSCPPGQQDCDGCPLCDSCNMKEKTSQPVE